MAFCVEHCEMAKKQNILVDLHGYLKFCSSRSKEDMPKTKNDQIKELRAKLKK